MERCEAWLEYPASAKIIYGRNKYGLPSYGFAR